MFLTLSKPSRCVSMQLVYIFTSYTTINIIIHTIKCYKFNGYMFRSPLLPSGPRSVKVGLMLVARVTETCSH